jgi:hypothetical protein
VVLLNAVAVTGTAGAQSGAPPVESRFETVLLESNIESSAAVRIALAGGGATKFSCRQEDE